MVVSSLSSLISTQQARHVDPTLTSISLLPSTVDTCDYNFSACQLIRLEDVWYRVLASFDPDGSGEVGPTA